MFNFFKKKQKKVELNTENKTFIFRFFDLRKDIPFLDELYNTENNKGLYIFQQRISSSNLKELENTLYIIMYRLLEKPLYPNIEEFKKDYISSKENTRTLYYALNTCIGNTKKETKIYNKIYAENIRLKKENIILQKKLIRQIQNG